MNLKEFLNDYGPDIYAAIHRIYTQSGFYPKEVEIYCPPDEFHNLQVVIPQLLYGVTPVLIPSFMPEIILKPRGVAGANIVIPWKTKPGTDKTNNDICTFHSWTKYHGAIDTYEYCTTCNTKRKWSPYDNVASG